MSQPRSGRAMAYLLSISTVEQECASKGVKFITGTNIVSRSHVSDVISFLAS
jgi:hypothetical protein